VGWQKWRNASGVLSDKKIPISLKGQVYRMVVRLALLYGAECWSVKKTQVQRLMIAEMIILRWMCGFARLDRIRNEVIIEKAGVAPIEEKLRESRLRWFGHVKRRVENEPLRKCKAINLIHCRRGRGRPKVSWNEVIIGDLKCMGLTEDMAQDRKLLRAKIRTIARR